MNAVAIGTVNTNGGTGSSGGDRSRYLTLATLTSSGSAVLLVVGLIFDLSTSTQVFVYRAADSSSVIGNADPPDPSEPVALTISAWGCRRKVYLGESLR